eukprot:superscaffoldBa00004267_g18565
MSGNANRATPLRGSRPPGFPAIGSSLKVTLQSGHADVAGLAVGMEPASPHSTPLFLLFLSRPPPILPLYPPHHHLKDTAPTPAGPVCLQACLPVCLGVIFFKDVSLLQMIGDTRTKEYRAALLGLSDSKLDCNMGFWQILLAEESAKLTTFITPFRRYHFNQLPGEQAGELGCKVRRGEGSRGGVFGETGVHILSPPSPGWAARVGPSLHLSFPAASPQPAVRVPVTSAHSAACPPPPSPEAGVPHHTHTPACLPVQMLQSLGPACVESACPRQDHRLGPPVGLQQSSPASLSPLEHPSSHAAWAAPTQPCSPLPQDAIALCPALL